MTEKANALPIDQAAVNMFYSKAWTDLDWDGMPSIMGEQTADGLLPPAFQFSDNRHEATAIAQQVVNGQKTSFTTPESEFAAAGMALPAVGDLSIICDGDGNPAALIEDYKVEVVNGNVIEHFNCRYPLPHK